MIGRKGYVLFPYSLPGPRTNSWRVLDADGNYLPTAGGTYFAAVFLQQLRSEQEVLHVKLVSIQKVYSS